MKIFLLSVLVAFRVIAGPHIIRGGGGLAEMQVIYLHQNLNQFVRVCVDSRNPCRLSSEDFGAYQSLIERHSLDSTRLNIQYVASLASQQPYELRGHKIILSSQSLYDSQSRPHDLRKLLAFVVAIRLDILGSQGDFLQKYDRALQIFENLYQRHQFHRVMGLSQLLLIHHYDIQFADFRSQKFFLENDKQTQDITSLISSRLPCLPIEAWQFQNWKSLVGQQDVFVTADLKSSCLDSRGRNPTLIIRVPIRRDSLIDVSVRF